MTGKELGKMMVEAVRQRIDQAINAIKSELSLEKEILDLQLLPLQKGLAEVQTQAGLSAQQILELHERPAPKDGKDVDMAVVAEAVASEVERAVGLIPPPAPGEKGDAGRDGRDGADGRDGVNGEPGVPGRDAVDMVLLADIDESKVYPRGTWAAYKGGTIFAVRKTDAITTTLEAAGWRVCMNGICGMAEEMKDEGRWIIRRTELTDGRVIESGIKTHTQISRGVFKADTDYLQGDTVTWAGSSWHCEIDTKEKPGGSEWRLIVKKGSDGRSAYDLARAKGFVGSEQDWLASLKGERGPEGKPGKNAY